MPDVNRELGKRGAQYKALKWEWGNCFVEVLLRFYPQLEGRIELVDVSTPLSIEHYLSADHGGAVGLDQSPQRFTDWRVADLLDARTPIKGLWLTGQDTVTCGQPIVRSVRQRRGGEAPADTDRARDRDGKTPTPAPPDKRIVAAEE